MINDVDESLRALLRRDVLDGAGVEISFEAPSKEWSVRRNTPTLNLYLYEIREDLERRQVQYEEVRDERGIVVDRRLPPRRFKLSYLLTAWTQRPDDEHRLLSSTLSCFLRFDALPEDILQGELAAQPYPVRITVGLPLPPERSISDVWTALGGELKPSLDLIVTTPFPTGRQFHPVGPPVLEEPRIALSRAPEPAEKPKSGRRRGRAGHKPEEAPGPETGSESRAEVTSEAPLASEVTLGGKGPAGRTLKIRTLPRP
ncbi:MAG: DUF4255 domain-containing protein [Actinomycetota bacterium]